ncbi:S1C family serine protease [Haloterrigena alkaliphila]|uniref:Trypsin-like peptidase domain-containing protein n=1 Tax=Haloterrigena alkaliphila TaxID=2816475 RepID=A0A8A2VC13_9EURY|nr:trypsin-like peptidase domain-containing protein [Haloterrigena alkaliphila]QSW99573.1 trypsin-like peptidase domain-containing protein [Haloterrigena alkaliphila]
MPFLGVEPRVSRDYCTRRRLLGAIGATAALGVGGVGGGVAQNETESANTTAQEGQGDGVDSPYTAVYRNTIDSVVLVTVSGTGGPGPGPGPGGGGGGGGGLGSGFVIDDQHIVTNNHVVAAASEDGIEIQFSNQEWRTASIVGTDVYSDLAVLRVDEMPDVAGGLSFVESQPAIGQEVLTLGNPLGFNASISQGIVSGVNRSLPSPTGFAIPAAIQTDASVNPGNSGGPLVNLDGEVLGVVFAGASQTIGFAISARLANRVVPALIEDGAYEHAYMGVGVLPVGPEIADAVGLEEAAGVLVAQVVRDGPADGVLEPVRRGRPGSGDVIVAIDGAEISTQAQLSSYLALETAPGDEIELEIVRDGERQTVALTLEERPDDVGP